MSFAHPLLLLLLWALPLAALLAVSLRHRARKHALRLAATSSLSARPHSTRALLQLSLWLAAAALAILALARPQWGEAPQTILSRGRNVVLLIDVSRSMLAEDVHPNRLERARVDLRDLLDDLKGDRAAIIAFRGSAVTLCPLTTDSAFLRQSLDALGVGSAPRGETHLGHALDAALELLAPFDSDHNAIVLVSDGEDLSGTARQAAERAATASIPIFTVGIGDTRGAAVPLANGTSMKYDGQEVVSKLDNETLADIATTSGGAYIPLRLAGSGGITLGTLYRDHLRRIAAQDFEERNTHRKIDRYQLFLYPAIALFLVVASLSTGRPIRRRTPRKTATAATLLALLLSTGLAASSATTADTATSAPSSPDVLARQAQSAFRDADYATAATLFSQASSLASDRPTFAANCAYNAALARLRAGDPHAAISALRPLTSDPAAPSSSQEALAVALFHAAQATTPTSETDTAAIQSRLFLLQDSATAFQTAAASSSTPPQRFHQNLAAATAELPALRKQARLAEIHQKYGQTPPPQLATDLLQRLRSVRAEAALALTNNTPNQITLFETAAKHQQETADLWTALQPQLEQLLSTTTNQQDLIQRLDALHATGESLSSAVSALEDADPAGIDALLQCEQSALGYFSLLADPRALLAEAIHAQTNAIDAAKSAAEARTPSDDQGLAAAMFNLFANRFPPWADQLPQSDPPALTPEARAEIEQLSTATLQFLQTILAAGSLPDHTLPESSLQDRTLAYSNMLRIQDLLPKDSNQKQDPPPQKEQSQQPESKPQPQPQPSPEQAQPEPEAEPSETPPPEKDPEQKDAEAILQLILDQEKERQEELRKLQINLPPRPHERDW